MVNRVLSEELRKRHKVMVSLSDRQKEQLERLALELGCSLAETSRRAIAKMAEDRGVDS